MGTSQRDRFEVRAALQNEPPFHLTAVPLTDEQKRRMALEEAAETLENGTRILQMCVCDLELVRDALGQIEGVWPARLHRDYLQAVSELGATLNELKLKVQETTGRGA